MADNKTIAGASLIAPIEAHRLAKDERQKFWIGLLPTARRPVVHVGGVTFLLVVEPPEVGLDGQTKWQTYNGLVTLLSREQIRAIAEGLPRLVLRPTRDFDPGRGSLAEVIDSTPAGRSNTVVRIASETELQEREKKGYITRRYSPEPYDEPLAAHVYCVRQDERSPSLPMPVSELGLPVIGDDDDPDE